MYTFDDKWRRRLLEDALVADLLDVQPAVPVVTRPETPSAPRRMTAPRGVQAAPSA